VGRRHISTYKTEADLISEVPWRQWGNIRKVSRHESKTIAEASAHESQQLQQMWHRNPLRRLCAWIHGRCFFV